MDKRKNLSIGNNLALCFIAIISIVIAIGAAALFYYFETYVDVSSMAGYYQVIKGGINVLFTVIVLAFMIHIQYKVLGKTLLSRMDMKNNGKIKQLAYWGISILLALMVLYVFDACIAKFDKYFLFMLLAIVEICDIVSEYMITEFKVSNEEISLSYLIYAAMISVCCYVVFNFSCTLIENQILEGHNNTEQFYFVTKNILSKVDSNNIVDLKDYVNRINSIKEDNELIEEYASWINSLPDVIDDDQLFQLKESLTSICATTDEAKLTQDYVNEKEDLRKALTIEGLLIFFISLATYILSCQVKKMLFEEKMKKELKKEVKKTEKEPKKEEKVAAKKEEKVVVKKEEKKPSKKIIKTKKEPQAKKTVVKKVEAKKPATKNKK